MGIGTGRAGIEDELREKGLPVVPPSSMLAIVYYAGWHHLVEPQDWPEELPAVVLDAVR
jgi:hypothetical protein